MLIFNNSPNVLMWKYKRQRQMEMKKKKEICRYWMITLLNVANREQKRQTKCSININ